MIVSMSEAVVIHRAETVIALGQQQIALVRAFLEQAVAAGVPAVSLAGAQASADQLEAHLRQMKAATGHAAIRGILQETQR